MDFTKLKKDISNVAFKYCAQGHYEYLLKNALRAKKRARNFPARYLNQYFWLVEVNDFRFHATIYLRKLVIYISVKTQFYT